jgi:hypothetical protein
MGGWDHTITQQTIITPEVVKLALGVANKFVGDFNQFLVARNLPPVQVGSPLGSTAYYEIDHSSKIYGDIDLQIIVDEVGELSGKTASQVQSYWNRLMAEFIVNCAPPYVHPESKSGHPILRVDSTNWVQVDMIPHRRSMQEWGQYRTTPEHNLKGMLIGNLFSSLAVVTNTSIQHDGVQYKTRWGSRQPYTTTRNSKANGNYALVTISTDIKTFVLDMFIHDAGTMGIQSPQVPPLLEVAPGLEITNVSASQLMQSIVGLAMAYDLNRMYGRDHLSLFKNSGEFLSVFFQEYKMKATNDLNSSKRDKAENELARWRADRDRNNIKSGLEKMEREFIDICHKYHIKRISEYATS